MENNAIVISNVGMEGEYVGPLIPDRAYGYFYNNDYLRVRCSSL